MIFDPQWLAPAYSGANGQPVADAFAGWFARLPVWLAPSVGGLVLALVVRRLLRRRWRRPARASVAARRPRRLGRVGGGRWARGVAGRRSLLSVLAVLLLLTVWGCSRASARAPGSSSPAVVAGGRQRVSGTVRGPGRCRLVAGKPQSLCAPGAVDVRVTQATIGRTICRRGYTKAIRPSLAATQAVRSQIARSEFFSLGPAGELDHLIPLELGGASDVRNLWLQPGPIPNAKDGLENRLHAAVCSGRLRLAAAQQQIVVAWSAGARRGVLQVR